MFLFTWGSKENVKFHVKWDKELSWWEKYIGPTACSNDTVQEGTRGYKRAISVSSDFRLREQNQNLQLKWERGTLCKAPRKRHTLCHILMFIKHNEQLQIKSCWCLTSTRQMLSMEKREWILITRGFQAASLNGKRKLFTMSTIAGAFTGPLQGLYTYKMSSQLLKQFCQWQLFCTVPISVNQMTSAGSTMNTSIWEITKLSVASEIVKLIWFFFFWLFFCPFSVQGKVYSTTSQISHCACFCMAEAIQTWMWWLGTKSHR